MLEFISSIWWMLVTLGVLVTFHEFGHFWVARKFGVHVLKFSVGFGKFFWSRIDKKGTEIGFAPIPLGGYVKMLDTRDPAINHSDFEYSQTYNSKPIWQRALIMFAGPAFNFVLAVLLFWGMFIYGKDEIKPILGEPTKLLLQAGAKKQDQIVSINGYPVKTWQDVTLELVTESLDRKDIELTVLRNNNEVKHLKLELSKLPEDSDETKVFENVGLKAWRIPLQNRVYTLAPGKPAELAGVEKGDRVIAVNGEETKDWYDVVTLLNKHIDSEINLTILRNNNTLNVIIAHAVDDESGTRRIIGIGQQPPSETDKEYYRSLVFSNSYGVFEALTTAFKETWRMTTVSLNMMGKIITGKASLKNLSGPITIAQVANDSASRGVAWFLGFLGLVSLSLGIINLMPIPMLDGGQLLFLLFEKIKGSPLSEEFQLKGQTVGVIFLLCFMSIAFYNDILRLVS